MVTLTEDPIEPPRPEAGRPAAEVVHFPIFDMCAPASTQSTLELCDGIATRVRRGEPVLVHCKAGIGRTGLLLACCLIVLGAQADEALLRLRRVLPAYVQSQVQEDFIHYFAAYVQRAAVEQGERTCPI